LLVLQRIPVLYRIDDHRPQHYIEKLAPLRAVSEFGDRVYAVPPAPALRLRRNIEHWGRRGDVHPTAQPSRHDPSVA
jgi:hypothetical protein